MVTRRNYDHKLRPYWKYRSLAVGLPHSGVSGTAPVTVFEWNSEELEYGVFEVETIRALTL